jgi:ribosomal protein S18 acetylase RimI-like enzyme
MAMIQVVDVKQSRVLREAGALVRRSFATVADEYRLTPANCPAHPAFQTDEDLLGKINRPGAVCFGAYQRDTLAGFVALLPQKRNAMELTRLCVAPEYRRREIGSFLLEYALAYAQKQGARKIVISVIDENRRLKAWYQGFGFVAIGRRRAPGLPFVVGDLVRTL